MQEYSQITNIDSKVTKVYNDDGRPKLKRNKLDDIIKTIRNLKNSVVNDIVRSLCLEIQYAGDDLDGFNVENFENLIIKPLNLATIKTPKQKKQIISIFLNIHKDKIICYRDENDQDSRDLHLFKVAASDGLIEFFKLFLFNPEYEIDLNVYQIVDEKKETLLDYIDKLINTGEYGPETGTLGQIKIHLEFKLKRDSKLQTH